MSSSKVGIFVATMTGLAEICAEEISGTLAAAGIGNEIFAMEASDISLLSRFDTILIVSSTYGHGDIPDNGQALFEALRSGADLAGKRYAIFALGDRTYGDTFCAAGDKWDEVLSASGAASFVPLERHDASAGTLAEDVAAEWSAGWAGQL